MTEHPRNLAAWLDDELGLDESALITRHVEGCEHCQARARSYAQVSGMLTELQTERRSTGRWRTAAIWAGAIAAAVMLAVALWPRGVKGTTVANVTIPHHRIAEARTTEVVVSPPDPPARRVHRRKPVAPRTVAPRGSYADGHVVRVAIPAEALFAPGAVPAGAQIYADLVLAADGSARELRLLP